MPDGHPFATAALSPDLCRQSSADDTFEQLLTSALCGSGGGPFAPAGVNRGDWLVLSGGSHNGSYGAGYLEGWGSKQGLPRFSIVTGISTGAVLSTSAFVGDSAIAAKKFNEINHERQLLKTFARMKNGKIVPTSVPTIMRHSAVADLSPLEGWLIEYLNDQVLRKVASRYQQEGARLLVGVVDGESGKAVAIDLTQLAHRYASTRDPLVQANARVCYARAIVASSSAPLAAKPVFIDNRSYVDGGLRYGVFFGSMSQALKATADRLSALRLRAAQQGAKEKAIPEVIANRPRLFVISNGTQTIQPWCEDDWTKDYCKLVGDPQHQMSTPRSEWNLLDLGLRAVDVMVNQLQRISVTDLEQKYELAFGTKEGFHYTRILPKHLDYVHHITEPGLDQSLSCSDWHEYDEEHLRPVQFHPHFMKCLIAAGQKQALSDPW